MHEISNLISYNALLLRIQLLEKSISEMEMSISPRVGTRSYVKFTPAVWGPPKVGMKLISVQY